jgi:hypothetical protein
MRKSLGLLTILLTSCGVEQSSKRKKYDGINAYQLQCEGYDVHIDDIQRRGEKIPGRYVSMDETDKSLHAIDYKAIEATRDGIRIVFYPNNSRHDLNSDGLVDPGIIEVYCGDRQQASLYYGHDGKLQSTTTIDRCEIPKNLDKLKDSLAKELY